MSFSKTLYGRLAAVLSALFAVIALSYLGLTLFTTERHLKETNQRLNRDLAQNLVKERLPMRAGEIDRKALEEIFHMMMVINPRIELYLLDAEGEILAFSAPEGIVVREHVALEPILSFLDGAEPLPILGDDPRSRERRKVFSVAPILSERTTLTPTSLGGSHTPTNVQGYLYIILAGQAYESVADILEGSYIERLGIGLMVANLAFVLAGGLVLFHVSTRRLRFLSASIARFRQSDFTEPPAPLPIREGGDEIDELQTAFHSMAERISRQMGELQEKDRLRRQLVANVSHDLRTPLASLHGYLETLALKQGKLTSEQEQEYLLVATRHSERLRKLVAELFELAKLDARETELEREPFSLAELIQDVVQELRLRAGERGIALEAELGGASGRVEADIRLIERALENLVENAIRFTPDGGRVTVRVAASGGNFIVEVEDTGCGIPTDELPHIFDRFYRSGRSDEGGGAGLGLAITKRILDLHGAPIEVESEMGRGALFRFALAAHRER